MAGFVLMHGTGFGGSCWELVAERLEGPVLAVDLPGRGAHPAELASLSLEDLAASVIADVEEVGLTEVVLVGHSLAGCSMPLVIDQLGSRLVAVGFIACATPADGQSGADLAPDRLKDQVGVDDGESTLTEQELLRMILGSDLTKEQLAWCVERMVPEAPQLITQPVPLAITSAAVPPRFWVRTMLDELVDPATQLRFAERAGCSEVFDLEAGHMCMVSKPAELASILNEVAARST
jgi:pimeloyl-ACP methyl ester carboxylesterase